MSLALAYVTGILSLIFAFSLLDQYMTRRQPQHLLWFIAFLLLSMSMGVWFLRETFGLNQWFLRLWFLGGSMLIPAYLGTGVLYWIMPKKLAGAFLGFLVVVTVAVLVIVLTADIKTPDECGAGLSGLGCLEPSFSMTKVGFFPAWIRLMSAVSNYYGGVAVLFGALWNISMLVRAHRMSAGAAGATQDAEGSFTADLAGAWSNTKLAASLMWQNRDFWRRDAAVQRAYANVIMTVSLVIGALGLTLTGIDDSAPHLGLFLAGAIVVYGGLLASKEAFETSPLTQAKDAIQALKSGG